jgi:hypothetical protein
MHRDIEHLILINVEHLELIDNNISSKSNGACPI